MSPCNVTLLCSQLTMMFQAMVGAQHRHVLRAQDMVSDGRRSGKERSLRRYTREEGWDHGGHGRLHGLAEAAVVHGLKNIVALAASELSPVRLVTRRHSGESPIFEGEDEESVCTNFVFVYTIYIGLSTSRPDLQRRHLVSKCS